jgi:hypothetical protein
MFHVTGPHLGANHLHVASSAFRPEFCPILGIVPSDGWSRGDLDRVTNATPLVATLL